jgi:hypothetical protein
VRSLVRSTPSYLLLQAYLFFEYVRPQTIYPIISFFPWARATLFGALILAVIERRLDFSRGKALWVLIAAFSAVIVLSSLGAVYPAYSLENAFVWVNWVILILLLGATVRTPNELLLLVCAFCLWNLKMSQHAVRSWASAGFQFRSWGVSGAPGWFQNSGEFGIEMCVFVPISVALTAALWRSLSKTQRLMLLFVPVSAVIGVVGSSSRGALVGLAALAAWAVLMSPYRLRFGAIALVAASAAWILLPDESKMRWETAGEDQTSINRITYWKHGIQIAQEYPLFGIGYQNWLPYYRSRFNPVGELPHNYFIECASQLGFIGLSVFCGILLAFFVLNARTRRQTNFRGDSSGRMLWCMTYGLDGAMIGFLASGFFVSVLWYPFIWMNLGLALGVATVARNRSFPRRLAGSSLRQHRPTVMTRYGLANVQQTHSSTT